MTDTKQTVMDIAMNLNRLGNWVADDFKGNQNKIDIFIKNTDGYISSLDKFNDRFVTTWQDFIKVYPIMKKAPKDNAENLMTWGNILTHRASLIE
jgi:hypothetical protein